MRSTVSPCLLVESIEDELAFLQTVFQATVQADGMREGTLWELEAQLGNTTLKIGHAHAGDSCSNTALYVWMDDVDATYERAIQAGATPLSEPTNQPWGVREAGFRAPQGNTWWIGKRTAKMSNREVEETLRKQRQDRL